ncbi:3-oxoacyl-[acyl-carrier-protein] reductase FabG [Halioglobus japonicus]|nr:3-oxoacyl-[acyl-carrier-protein] reductase FabG [Halioglobus japonicus]
MAHTVDAVAQYGNWALVTGSTAGIGREFASQLAAAGFNLALLARGADQLQVQCRELASAWGIDTRAIPCDLSSADYLSTIAAATDSLPIAFFVNNAGAESYHGRFLDRSAQELEDCLRLNTLVQLRLIHHFAQRMATAGGGAIIQVSSIAGHMPLPFMAEYSASKAYQLTLGEALYYELKDHRIDFLTLSPGATKSRRISYGMEPAPVVRTALAALGQQPSVIPGWRNKLSAFRHRYLKSRRAAVHSMGDFQRTYLK